MAPFMELRTLKYAVAVYDEASVTRAAERLGIAQPALSVALKTLERELGTPLFIRVPRGVEATDAGRAFVQRARATLDSAGAAIAEARAAAAGQAGVLRLGLTASSLFVPAFREGIARFRRARPNVRLELRQLLSLELIAALLREELDVACVRGIAGTHGAVLAHTLLARERFVALVPEGDPLAKKRAVDMPALAAAPFVFFPAQRGHGTYEAVMQRFLEYGVAPRIVQEADEGHTILGLVAAGAGVSILPASLAEARMPGVAVRPLRPALGTNLALVRRRGARHDRSLAAAFVAIAVR